MTPETQFGPHNTFRVVGLAHNLFFVFAMFIFSTHLNCSFWEGFVAVKTPQPLFISVLDPELLHAVSTIKKHSLRFVAQFQFVLQRLIPSLDLVVWTIVNVTKKYV